jgi:hypothetical protein
MLAKNLAQTPAGTVADDAFPTRLEVMKPARAVAFGSAFFKKPIVSVSPRMVFPSARTRRNSESRVNRRDFGKRKRFSIDRILVWAMTLSSRASAEGSR